MKKNNTLLIRLEFIWWVITAIVTAIIISPIIYKLPDYRFLWTNVAFIVVFITLSRHIFLLRYTFLANWRNIKVAIIFLCLFLLFLLVQEINAFQTFLDENGSDPIVGLLPREDQQPMLKYIRSEMLLFGVGGVIACILLPIRLVVSIWRRWNGYEAL